ncbi:MAG: DeoR family transcriptional regulator, partial [Proteobacteria bacterium]
RTLATDSLGHGQVRLGQINQGLVTLAEAQRLAKRIGNKSMAAAIEISRDLYACEYGIEADPVGRLTSLWEASGPENNYSQANVGLELARHLTLHGKFLKAQSILETVAPLVYANQNRRHEIQLNLRLAELSGRRGSFFPARHFVWFSRRLLNKEVDGSLELQALGIEAKLSAAEGQPLAAKQAQEKAASLGSLFPSARERNLRARLNGSGEENQEDRVHAVLKAAAAGLNPEDRLKPLLTAAYLAEASLALKLPPGAPAIAVMPGRLGLLVQCPDAIEWRHQALSPLQHKLLTLFQRPEVSKQVMVESAWGYAYDSLRHDNMVYAALSTLRRALGNGGAWITPTENGYRLGARLLLPTAPLPSAPLKEPAKHAESSLHAELHHRQLEILEWLKEIRFCSVRECQAKFATSEITALRDLNGLCKLKFVVRTGKARATRYSAPSKENA